jgi:transcriptional regulator with XRE-family HTH domain
MSKYFGEMVRRLRMERNLSQQELANLLHVSRTSVANWEGGRRMPDVGIVSLLAEVLGADVAALFTAAGDSDEVPNVLLVDDCPIILKGGLPILRQGLPGANVVGFSSRPEVLNYVHENPVALLFLDIVLGRDNGLDLCRELLKIRPRTNVIYLTNYKEYSFDAWDTGACGFMLKPLELEAVRKQILNLRYPVKGLI